jgi:hypothetical protein
MVILGLLGILLGWQLGKDLLFKPPSPPEPSEVQMVREAPSRAVPSATAEEHSSLGSGRRWDLPGKGRILPGIERFTPPDRGSIQKAAATAGLNTVRIALTWNQLLRMRRSCILEVRTPADVAPRYFVMRGISPNAIWIEQENEVLQRLSRTDLEAIWKGVVWLLKPPGEAPAMAASEPPGDVVLALQRALSQLGYWSGPYTGDYDKATRGAVMAFQKDLNLPESGDADLRTRALLSQLVWNDEGAL